MWRLNTTVWDIAIHVDNIAVRDITLYVEE
jgi:hypothetical protein